MVLWVVFHCKDWKIRFFLSRIFKGFFKKNRVYGRLFNFCNFFCNEGALISHHHVVALRVLVTISWPAKTTEMTKLLRVDFWARVMQTFRQFQSECFSVACFSFPSSCRVHVFSSSWGHSVPLKCFPLEILKVMIFLVTNNQTVFQWKPCLCKIV